MAFKKDLVERVSIKTGIHEEDISFIYNVLFEELIDIICKEESFSISGFGKFYTYNTKERGKLIKDFTSIKKIKFSTYRKFIEKLNK